MARKLRRKLTPFEYWGRVAVYALLSVAVIFAIYAGTSALRYLNAPDLTPQDVTPSAQAEAPPPANPVVPTHTPSPRPATRTDYTPPANAQSYSSPGSGWVYVTDGDCYHRAGCRTMKGAPQAVAVAQAVAAGRRPCRVCKP